MARFTAIILFTLLCVCVCVCRESKSKSKSKIKRLSPCSPCCVCVCVCAGRARSRTRARARSRARGFHPVHPVVCVQGERDQYQEQNQEQDQEAFILFTLLCVCVQREQDHPPFQGCAAWMGPPCPVRLCVPSGRCAELSCAAPFLCAVHVCSFQIPTLRAS